jgi:hypothetical protein
MEDQVWAIAKWEEVYEKADCRKLKTLSWVSMPTGFTSHGYSLMLEEFGDDAAAIYGAWCALVKVAATCNRRGILATTSGKPIRLSHVARLTGFPQIFFERLFKWASGDDVKWLVPTTCDESGRISGDAGRSLPTISGNAGRFSGESPGMPGDCYPPHYPTQPNQTEHNQTPPNPTGQTDGARVGGGGELKWDAEVAKRLAERLRRRFSKEVLPTGVCLQVALAASALEPEFVSTLLTDCQGREIGSPRHYVLKAVTNMALRHGWEWNALVAEMPQAKQGASVG